MIGKDNFSPGITIQTIQCMFAYKSHKTEFLSKGSNRYERSLLEIMKNLSSDLDVLVS